MKIDHTRKSAGTSGTKKTSSTKSGASGFEEYIEGASSAKESAPASAPQSIARVDALLAVQAVEDPTERAARKRMTARADNVLQELDQLHMSLLNNTMSMDHMLKLADTVAAHKERVHDSKLSALLEEIDLRAQIELAKMRKALGGKYD
jgi:hypothetical protein